MRKRILFQTMEFLLAAAWLLGMYALMVVIACAAG